MFDLIKRVQQVLWSWPIFIALILNPSAANDAPQATAQTTVRIRLAFEAATLDWNKGDVPITIIQNTIEGLYQVNTQNQIVANQAQGLPQKKSNHQYLITLKKNIRWSDQQPVRAADYIYSWNRLKNPATASSYRNLLKDFISFKAVNPQQIAIEYRSNATIPLAAVLSHWTTFPVRADKVAQHGDQWTNPIHNVYNGPYLISQHKPGQMLVLKPNPAHRKPGSLATIEALIIEDDLAALRLFERGELHFISDLAALDLNTLRKRSDYYYQPSHILVYLAFDCEQEPYSNLEFRQTIANSINRVKLIAALNGKHQPSTTLFFNTLENLSQLQPPANTIKPLKNRAEFAFFLKANNRTLAEFLQGQLKNQINLTLNLVPYDVKTYWQLLAQKPFGFFLNSYGAPALDPSFYFELFRSNNPLNMARWQNNNYDQALDQKNYRLAQKILNQESCIVPLYFRAFEYLQSAKLKNLKLNRLTSIYFDQATLEP